MKSQAKAVIQPNADDRTFYKDGILTLQFSGTELETVKQYFTLRGLRPGSVTVTSFGDKETRSQKQNRTFHLFVAIAHKSDLFGNDYVAIKNCFKQSFGRVYFDWKDFNGKWHSSLESTANYSKEQFAQLMSESVEHIIKVFNEHSYYDKRLDDIVREFNSQKIESKPDKLELF